MRVLQVIPLFVAGGAERLALTFHRAYLEQGLDSRLVSLTGVCPPQVPHTISLGLPSARHPAAVLRLRKLFRAKDGWPGHPDVIHTHLFPDRLFTPPAARWAGLRSALVTTEHSTSNRRRSLPMGRTLDRLLYRPYDAIACVSEGTREALAKWLPEFESKLVTINNGIDCQEFGKAARPERTVPPLIIISVGRLAAVKNYQTALAAIARLRHLDIEYRIIGIGPEEASLRKLARELGVRTRVRFIGRQPRVAPLLAEGHMFLLTSRHEGFGLVVAEAMAAGLPVVVSDVPGVREVAGAEGDCGYLVDPFDSAAIAERLQRLAENPALRGSMGARGRERARRFDIQETVNQYVRLYESVIISSTRA